IQTVPQLCQLFATILLFCNPSKPEELWASFWEWFCEKLRFNLIALGFQNPSEMNEFDYGLH
ncbi:hypothetical protein GYMLUDRAFT_122085, partial [Collybiopsis luxurians FD-317 M1]